MICINDKLAYRRIGKTIYVIKEVDNEEVLYEFEGDSFNILNSIMYHSCDSLEKIKEFLSDSYIFEESSNQIIQDYINELKDEEIIYDK